MVFTDHKPVTYALYSRRDKYSPRETKYFDYISGFTLELQYKQGEGKIVADTLVHTPISSINMVS